MKTLYIFVVLFLLKIIINLVKYLQCKYYLGRYLKWVQRELKGWSLVEAKQKVKSLFDGASISDSFVSHVEPAGYGMVTTAEVSVMKNFPNAREDMFQITLHFFHEAIGVYRHRIIETINPLYWIELIIFLPKKISSYFGVKPDKVVVKLFQFLYWLLSITIGFIYAIYKTEIDLLVKETISSIIK